MNSYSSLFKIALILLSHASVVNAFDAPSIMSNNFDVANQFKTLNLDDASDCARANEIYKKIKVLKINFEDGVNQYAFVNENYRPDPNGAIPCDKVFGAILFASSLQFEDVGYRSIDLNPRRVASAREAVTDYICIKNTPPSWNNVWLEFGLSASPTNINSSYPLAEKPFEVVSLDSVPDLKSDRETVKGCDLMKDIQFVLENLRSVMSNDLGSHGTKNSKQPSTQ